MFLEIIFSQKFVDFVTLHLAYSTFRTSWYVTLESFCIFFWCNWVRTLLCDDPWWGLFLSQRWALCEFLRKDILFPAIWKILFKMSLLIPYVHFHTFFLILELPLYRLEPYESSFIWLIFSILFFLFPLILRGFLDFMCQFITSKCSFLFSGYSFHGIFLLYR